MADFTMKTSGMVRVERDEIANDWKREFLDLYMSADVEKFGQALELKRLHIPQKLYRYRALNDENITYRFGEIVRGELYMSHPSELNDPFEAASNLAASKPAAYMTDKEDFTKLFKDKMNSEDFERVFSSDSWYENMLAYVAEKSVPKDKVESTKAILSQIVMEEFEKINYDISDMTRKMVRVACFTTTPDNLPMWHHYTNGHTGICLEYNTDDIKNVYQINKLFPVYYIDKMPDMTNRLLQKRHPEFGFIDYLTIHKLKDWGYENEWRLIYDAGSWYFGPEDIPQEYWTHGKVIPFVRPARVIMGMRISEKHEKKIREYAELAGIPAIKATQTEYGLKID
jgi:ribosomal protein L30E